MWDWEERKLVRWEPNWGGDNNVEMEESEHHDEHVSCRHHNRSRANQIMPKMMGRKLVED